LFPDYGIRFKYPGKVGQSILFEKLRIPHPATKRWSSVKKFRDRQKQQSAPPHDMPFFLKADKSHEGEGVYFVDGRNNFEKLSDSLMNPSPLMGEGKGGGGKDGEHSSTSLFPPPLYPLPPGEGKPFVGQSLETALGRLEKAGPEGFISQKAIPCGGNVLRAVVLHKRIITYWKRPGKPDGVITTVSHGARVDKEWKPELQEKGRAQAQWISEKTGINLAAFDFVFDPGNPDPQPFILEINYYFGRRGLGGSLRYYRLLLKAIREWLKESGFNTETIKLV
jgi:ribosomal protein S6--L-glutamate ligase